MALHSDPGAGASGKASRSASGKGLRAPGGADASGDGHAVVRHRDAVAQGPRRLQDPALLGGMRGTQEKRRLLRSEGFEREATPQDGLQGLVIGRGPFEEGEEGVVVDEVVGVTAQGVLRSGSRRR